MDDKEFDYEVFFRGLVFVFGHRDWFRSSK